MSETNSCHPFNVGLHALNVVRQAEMHKTKSNFFGSWKDVNFQDWSNSLRNDLSSRYNITFLRSTNLLILSGIRKNCHSRGRDLLLYWFIKRVLNRLQKLQKNVAVTKHIQNVHQYSLLKFNSILRRNYWEISVWIST